jgi:hypothetical protein
MDLKVAFAILIVAAVVIGIAALRPKAKGAWCRPLR